MTGLDRLAALSLPRWWLLLIGTALIARLTWAVALAPREPRFDERAYISYATSLAEGKGYVDERGRPTAYWPVGYPALLAVGYFVAGNSALTGIVLQMILGVATCVLVASVGSSVFGPLIGRSAALLLAVYPTHVFYTTLQMTEPLFAVLVVAAVAFLLKSLVHGSALEVAAGLTLGLAALVRPTVLLLPLALPVWYWFRGAQGRKVFAGTVLVTCCALIVVSPWLVRNHGLTHSWFVISTNGGHVFLMGNHPGAFGGYAFKRDINEQLRDGPDYDYSRGYRLGLAAIAASPLQAGLRALQKVTYFFALETDGVLWNLKGLAQPPPRPVTLLLLAVANAAYVFVICFAVLGLMGTSWTHPLASLFLVITSYLVLVAAVFVGDPRYHHALVPLAAIFSAKGFAEDWPALSKAVRAKDLAARRKLMAWGAIVLVFLIVMAANVVLKAIEFRSLPSYARIPLYGF